MQSVVAVNLATVGMLVIQQGETESLFVEADDNILPLIVTSVKDGTLTIDSSRSFSDPTTLTYTLTVLEVNAITLSGAGTINGDNLSGDVISLENGGSGSIALGDLGSVLPYVLAAIAVTIVTNTLGGVLMARIHGLNQRAAINAASVLLSRGEFSLILATLAIAAGLDGRIGPFVALYVLLLALVGPILAARSGRLSVLLPRRILGGFRYVERVPIVASCPHPDGIAPAARGSYSASAVLRCG